MVPYSSPSMEFTYSGCEGLMYKRIEDIKLYHTSGWHKKYFKIVFEDSILQIYDSKHELHKRPKTLIWL